MSPIFNQARQLTFVGLAACCLALSACDSTVLTCKEDCQTDAGASGAENTNGSNTGDSDTGDSDTGDSDTNGSNGSDSNGSDSDTELANIVETAAAAGNFTMLAAALESAGLLGVLSDDSQEFTVFAPTDAAFEALGQEAVDALLADSEALDDTLRYHLLPGSVDAEAAIALVESPIAMQNYKAATLSYDGETLMINNANVIQADIAASNGIIHVIDAVLIPPEETLPLNIVQTADNAGNFTTLLAALEQSGLDQVLSDSAAEYTVFAPTDAAFEALGEEALNALLADAEALNSTLLYHVLPSAVDSATAIALAGTSINMQSGSSAALSLDGETLQINNANVIATDITATNGVIHVIDAVLTPPNVDILPDPDPSPVQLDLVATLANQSDYSLLLEALQTANLDTVLADSESTFTVFAPNNAAFEAADADIQQAIADDPGVLSTVLLGHVFPDSIVNAETALTLNGQQITMANGANRTITAVDGAVTLSISIDGATVVEADIEASNGIIHGIDTVLLDLPSSDE